MSDILISIRPRHVAKILDGSKLYELRRTFHKKHENARLWIYETSPTCAVVAVAWVHYVDDWYPDVIWDRHGAKLGVTHEEFCAYFAGADWAFAIMLRSVRKLPKPITLTEMRAAGIQPPQSYRTVPAEIAAAWEAKR